MPVFSVSQNRALSLMIALLCVCVVLFSLHSGVFHRSLKRLPEWAEMWSSNEQVSFSQVFLDQESDSVRWGQDEVPPTKIVAHAPGWTIFDRLYVIGGTVFVVTDYPGLVPPPKEITSKGQMIEDANRNMEAMEPTDEEFRVISTQEARQLFGESAIRVRGVTFWVNESAQYITHLYHFVAELLFGIWRIYSSLDPNIQPNGHTILPAPRRMVFPHLETTMWRDYASMNQYILRALFPSLVLEFFDTWEERRLIPHQVFSYDRVVLSDRVAAMHGDAYMSTSRIASEAYKIRSGNHWWQTIRMGVLEFAKVRKADVLGLGKPVITYISRQKWGRRMLKEEDHLRLVAKLEGLRDRRDVEVHIVEMDRLTRGEQIRLAAKTTIMMGVHGNGLTALLWMRPTPQSAVIEFFYPKGFARDYQWTAEALGISHFGVWDKHVFTIPNLPPRAYPEGFQGNHIPLDADTVIAIIERRLDQKGVQTDI